MYKITQQRKLLEALRRGAVNSFDATYQLNIKQAPTRIRELKEKGYDITSHPGKRERSVDWVLNEVQKPQLRPLWNKDGTARMVTQEEWNLANQPEQLTLNKDFQFS